MSDRQMLILVDENDIPTGQYEDKGECHFGEGLHHRAFVVVLENKKGEVLLQLRKHVRWDKFWDVTAISHVLHLEDHDETYEEAGLRSLEQEMGITDVHLKKIGGFNYFAKYHGHCENEYCAVLIGTYDEAYTPNAEVLYDTKWMKKEEFYKEVEEKPDKYTPWVILAVKEMSSRA